MSPFTAQTTTFNDLSDDLLLQILLFLGTNKSGYSYLGFGLCSKRFNHIFNVHNLPKLTSLSGYASLQKLTNKFEAEYFDGEKEVNRDGNSSNNNNDENDMYEYKDHDIKVHPIFRNITRAILHYGREELLHWSLFHQTHQYKYLLFAICFEAAKTALREDAKKQRMLRVLLQILTHSNQDTINCLKKSRNLNRMMTVSGAKYDNLDLLKLLSKSGFDLHSDSMTYAARSGNLDVLQWIYKKGEDEKNWTWKFGSYHCSLAAAGGHLETLKWLKSIKCHFDSMAASAAAGSGNLAVLEWLYENDCFIFTTRACVRAAKNEHLHILEFFRNNGCEWDRYNDYLI